MSNLTPMMKQYLEIKKDYQDSILFFRLGDFYEMFYEDAKIASKELEITLTARAAKDGRDKIDMCGVPYHVADSYIAKLVEKGYKVAICEQVEDPKEAKGIVKREVIRVITPGTILDNNVLDEKSNNYLASIYINQDGIGFAYVDMSTGDINVTEETGSKSDLYSFALNELGKILPSEILSNKFLTRNKRIMNIIENRINPFINIYEDKDYNFTDSFEKLDRHFENNIDFIKYKPYASAALCKLLDYLADTHNENKDYISYLNYYNAADYMIMDINTMANLEIKETLMNRDAKGSLLWILDKTSTAMGARLLKQWLEKPLLDKERIEKRQDTIKILVDDLILRDEIREYLKAVYDLERIMSKITYGTCNARDLLSLKSSLEPLPGLKKLLLASNDENIEEMGKNLDDLRDIYELIHISINEEAPITLREGRLIKVGFNEDLDKARAGSIEGKKWIAELESKEKERTGIKNLKIGFNKQSGYFFEVTKANLKLVPDNFIRTRTLKNSERFYTQELKDIEYEILTSEDRSVDLEYDIFQVIRNKIKDNTVRIQNTSKTIAYIDVIRSLAEVAYNNNYIKPNINIDGHIDIREGRHPVVESTIMNEHFVPNDTFLDHKDNMVQIITGPNMSGKSTYMRQVAIIVLMAQIGSFVPASYADISIVDRIFTRIGASDNLSQGESTFMVEMNEVANIINNASSHSLLILDEVGRGTSTYDGLSIAWALLEHIANRIGAKTLFATHYHELTELEKSLDGVKNLTVMVDEEGGELSFLRKIIPGTTNKSYGIEVAKLAGIDKAIVGKAQDILSHIEGSHSIDLDKLAELPEVQYEKVYHNPYEDLIAYIEDIDMNNITPIEALNRLNKIKSSIEEIKDDLND